MARSAVKKGEVKLQLVHKKILMGEATGLITVRPVAEAAIYNLKKRSGYHNYGGSTPSEGH